MCALPFSSFQHEWVWLLRYVRAVSMWRAQQDTWKRQTTRCEMMCQWMQWSVAAWAIRICALRRMTWSLRNFAVLRLRDVAKPICGSEILMLWQQPYNTLGSTSGAFIISHADFTSFSLTNFVNRGMLHRMAWIGMCAKWVMRVLATLTSHT